MMIDYKIRNFTRHPTGTVSEIVVDVYVGDTAAVLEDGALVTRYRRSSRARTRTFSPDMVLTFSQIQKAINKKLSDWVAANQPTWTIVPQQTDAANATDIGGTL